MEIAETLKKMAGELRKAAEDVADHENGGELDPVRVRDFLVFYGSGAFGGMSEKGGKRSS